MRRSARRERERERERESRRSQASFSLSLSLSFPFVLFRYVAFLPAAIDRFARLAVSRFLPDGGRIAGKIAPELRGASSRPLRERIIGAKDFSRAKDDANPDFSRRSRARYIPNGRRTLRA